MEHEQQTEIQTETKLKETEEELKRKSRKISVKEGSAFSVSDGFGLRYITPYALALGASNAHIGFLSSIPSLLGSLSQLHAAKVMEKISRKKLVFFGVLLQALMWLTLISIGILFFVLNINSQITPALLVLFYSLLILFGAFAGPAWSSWMKDLVTRDTGKYFGRRNRICGTIALISMLIAGFVLDYFKKTNLFIGFAILFGIAFIFRGISALLFLKKYEPELKLEKGYYFSFLQFLKRMTSNNFGKFVIFVSLISLTTAIASPFFAVYMLKELHFSYVSYIVVIMSSSFSSLLFMPAWGKFADSYGNIKCIKFCGFLVSIVPFLWLSSPLISQTLIIPYLIIVEIFSGFAWAGFNLTASNFIYDAVTRQRMALCVAYFSILNAIGVFIGATIGGIVSSMSFVLFSLTPLLFVFLLSGVSRLIVAFIMNPKIKEVRDVKKFGIKEAREKLLTITPEQILRYLDIKIMKPRPTQPFV